jgi:sensor domain CHASE-containing protein
MAVETLILKSSELRKGDIVIQFGMRILIDQEIKDYPGAYGDVYHTNGLVTNIEEVKEAEYIPVGWLYPDVFRGGWQKDYDADPRWVIQGNDLATWAVERKV